LKQESAKSRRRKNPKRRGIRTTFQSIKTRKIIFGPPSRYSTKFGQCWPSDIGNADHQRVSDGAQAVRVDYRGQPGIKDFVGTAESPHMIGLAILQNTEVKFVCAQLGRTLTCWRRSLAPGKVCEPAPGTVCTPLGVFLGTVKNG
jgi:hypothetical protein